jgi:hypothetical protein
VICFAQDDADFFDVLVKNIMAPAIALAEEEFFGAEFFYGVAELGGSCVRLLHCG